jgi:hypothetical protein
LCCRTKPFRLQLTFKFLHDICSRVQPPNGHFTSIPPHFPYPLTLCSTSTSTAAGPTFLPPWRTSRRVVMSQHQQQPDSTIASLPRTRSSDEMSSTNNNEKTTDPEAGLQPQKPAAGPPGGPPPNGGLTAWLQVLGGFFLFFNTWVSGHCWLL